MYPSPENPVYGAFVKRQEDALRRLDVEFYYAVDSAYRPREKSLQKYVALARKVAALRSQPFDLVHVHFPNLIGVYAGFLAQGKRVPLIATFHGGELDPVQLQEMSFAKRAITRQSAIWTARHAFSSIAVGPEIVQELLAAGAPPDKVFQWDMGVDCAKCGRTNRPSARQQLGLQEDAQIVVFAGWLTESKGASVVVHAAHLLRHRQPHCRWHLLGSGPLESTLAELVRTLDLADIITLAGRRSWDEVQLWNAAADVHVMPSLAEAFGLSCLEAMACSTPVVASAVGGLRSLVTDGENGFLIPPGDAQALADRVSLLLADPARAGEMGARGQQAAQQHDIHVQARKVYDLYAAAIAAQK